MPADDDQARMDAEDAKHAQDAVAIFSDATERDYLPSHFPTMVVCKLLDISEEDFEERIDQPEEMSKMLVEAQHIIDACIIGGLTAALSALQGEYSKEQLTQIRKRWLSLPRFLRRH